MATDGNESVLFSKLRKLINIVDELRDLGLQAIIPLPRIAVLGMQSAGKSSVLESIAGYDFLPRGDGLVTRTPCEIRLIHVNDSSMKPYVIFGKDKAIGRKIDDNAAITARINEITDEIAGVRKGIVNRPITMEVFANSCPDLTLIDLPGIAKVPLKGSDHGDDIEEVTKNMAISYCADEMTIILCVIQANIDLATSDALKIARKLDPNGDRTLGVLTKIDLMDSGTNAVRVLENDEIPLKYGYVAVKGRSQADIKSGMSIKEGLVRERVFFENHQTYSKLVNKREVLGVEALTYKLTSILNKHIKKNLPKIVQDIKEKTEECEYKLNQLGTPLPVGTDAKMQTIWKMIDQYVNSFKDELRARFSRHQSDPGEEKISAVLRRNFNDIFSEQLSGKNDLSYYLEDKQIEQAFINFEGNALPGFPSSGGFLSLLHPFIDKLYQPVYDVVDNAFYSLENFSKKLITSIFGAYPGLEDIITELSGKILQRQRDFAKKTSQDVLDSERGYLYTSDSSYIVTFGNFLPPPCHQAPGSTEKKLFIKQVRERISSYLQLTMRTLRDIIPKIIGQILVNKTLNTLSIEINEGVTRVREALEALSEPEHVQIERDTLSKTIRVLRAAQKKLQKEGIMDGTEDD